MISETVTIWGFKKDSNVSVVVREVEPGVRMQSIGKDDSGININLTWTLVDYRDGVQLIDVVEYTGRRFLANLVLGIAEKAHRVILDGVKVHAENKQGKQ